MPTSAPRRHRHRAKAPLDALFGAAYDRLKVPWRAWHTRHDRAGSRAAPARDISGEFAFEHQAQFFACAARAMRHPLIDRAHSHMRQKTSGDWIRTTLTASADDRPSIASAERAFTLEQALTKLERTDQRATRVVELRYLTGLWPGQIAEPPGLTRRTIGRDRRIRAHSCAALE